MNAIATIHTSSSSPISVPQDVYYTRRIKIESQDQFVPAFLALYHKPELYSGYFIDGYPVIRDSYLTLRNGLGQRNKEMIGSMDMLLNSPVVSEYSTLHRLNMMSSVNLFDVPRIFSGEKKTNNYTWYFESNYGQKLSTYGLIGSIERFPTPTTETGHFKLVGNTHHKIKLSPLVMLVVKAKWLALLRAGLLLKQGISIPLTDIKILKVANLNSGMADIYRTIAETLPEGFVVEYTTPEVMSSYLYPPEPRKTAAQYLQDAIKVAESAPEDVFKF